MLSTVRDDRGRPLPAVCLIEPVVRHFCRKSSNVRLSNLLLFSENCKSLGRKSIRFKFAGFDKNPRKFAGSDKILSLELNAFYFIVVLLVLL